MPRLSKNTKQKWNFFINSKTDRRTYNEFCRNAVMIVSKAIIRLLFAVPNFNQKGLQNANPITPNSIIVANPINVIRNNF